MPREEIKKHRYFFAAVFTLGVFFMGLLFSNLVDDHRSAALQEDLRDDIIGLESQQLQINYLDRQEDCSVLKTGLTETTKDYNDNLERVQSYEDGSLLKSGRFHDIRHQFVLSGIRYWLFAQEVRQRCPDYDPHTLLYFGTDDCPGCNAVRNHLERVKDQYGAQTLIYHIHTDIDDGMVRILKNRFGIETIPSVVVNEETVLEGSVSKQRIVDEIESVENATLQG